MMGLGYGVRASLRSRKRREKLVTLLEIIFILKFEG